MVLTGGNQIQCIRLYDAKYNNSGKEIIIITVILIFKNILRYCFTRNSDKPIMIGKFCSILNLHYIALKLSLKNRIPT